MTNSNNISKAIQYIKKENPYGLRPPICCYGPTGPTGKYDYFYKINRNYTSLIPLNA